MLMSYIACGECKVELDGPDDPRDEDVMACPRCGRSDTYEVVKEEFASYWKDCIERSKGVQRARRPYRYILSGLES